MTLEEIARLSGISRGTIDRVLKKRGGVSPRTEQLVLQALEQYDYRPNRAGVALVRSRRPIKIGVLLNAAGNPFFDDVLAGVRAAERDYADYGLKAVVRQEQGYSAAGQIQALDALLADGLDALAVAPVDDETLAEKLRSSGKPIVTVNTDCEASGRLCYIGCDYLQSGRTAGLLAGMLAREGRCAVLHGSDAVSGHRLRLQGFCDVLQNEYPSIHLIETAETGDSDDAAFAAAYRLFSARQTPDVLYLSAGGVQGAMRAVAACKATPLVVAHDVTAVTRDLVLQGRIAALVTQQPYQQGYKSVKILFDALTTGVPPACDTVYTELGIRLKYNL